MKVLTMYLPQFHRTPENDSWWGEGYTEWTAVRKMEPLFEGHRQPVVPLEGEYNLLDKKTMLRQAELMKQYGIDGQCFYHYYFSTEKKMLEKPAENLLRWTDVNMPFCFSWANESWKRTWSNLFVADALVWSERYDNGNEEKKQILLKQIYGEKEEWRQHFLYLLPFFKDERYLKEDGKPVFIIYRPDLISCLEEMLDFWEKLAKREGFPGLYVIGNNVSLHEYPVLNDTMIQEPQKTIRDFFPDSFCNTKNLRYYLNYDEIWENILNRRISEGCLGGFVKYDDTPRRGKNGTIIYDSTPDKFKYYLERLIVKGKAINSRFIFINAWNEWAEGMFLEPDTNSKYSYLEAFQQAKKGNGISETTNQSWDNDFLTEQYTQEIRALQNRCNRYNGYWTVLDRWLTLKEHNYTIAKWIKDNGYASVAIYGVGMLGRHLLYELKSSYIKCEFVIDRSEANCMQQSFEITKYSPEEKIPAIDLIIITPFYDIKKIYNSLKTKTDATIIGLDELINNCIVEIYE